ncbi:MAG: peptide chain release factor N(5)-glutamine methyltransferase [Chitinophagaceae bacterium]|nr:peptide chain release factor N(5)-glutamine methyltransferase [Chitinophagaceae bacterium]
MTYREASTILTQELNHLYDSREASQLTDWVIEHVSGKKKSERLIAISQEMSAEEIQKWKVIKKRLVQGEPIQYVLNQAPFMEWIFFVDRATLIPRPETEELVAWVLSDHNSAESLKVFDIGTGSGCIAIALQLKRPNWKVIAGDISLAALETAQMNAQKYGAELQLAPLNILGSLANFKPQNFDLIVSNPPYIPLSEQNDMSYHVTGFEPKEALFVPDEQPLLFYAALGKAALLHLREGGMMYVEIHQRFGTAVVELFEQMGFTTTLRKDVQGNDRMVRAVKK